MAMSVAENEDCLDAGSKTEDITHSTPDAVLSEYIKSVHSEKSRWAEYAKSLTSKYRELKRNVNKERIDRTIDFNFLDYLPDEEKNFCLKIRETMNDFDSMRAEMVNAYQSLYLMHHELENQKLLKTQLVCAKTEQLIKRGDNLKAEVLDVD